MVSVLHLLQEHQKSTAPFSIYHCIIKTYFCVLFHLQNCGPVCSYLEGYFNSNMGELEVIPTVLL